MKGMELEFLLLKKNRTKSQTRPLPLAGEPGLLFFTVYGVVLSCNVQTISCVEVKEKPSKISFHVHIRGTCVYITT